MGMKINVRRRIVVNGVEYDGPEALPPDLRAAFEKAVAGQGLKAGGSVKVTFNGQEYASADHMPPDIRALYEAAMKAVDDPAAAQALAPGGEAAYSPGEVRPVVLGPAPSSPRRWLVLGLAIVIGLLTLYFLMHAGSR